MPTYSIRIINKDFAACEPVDVENEEAARSQGLKGALQIGVEEVCQGKPFFAAEVSIENAEKTIERMMVAIGTSPLQNNPRTS